MFLWGLLMKGCWGIGLVFGASGLLLGGPLLVVNLLTGQVARFYFPVFSELNRAFKNLALDLWVSTWAEANTVANITYGIMALIGLVIVRYYVNSLR